uniref:Uncharacterized protein n=1 Tax=viral metagenome TaxID=1070528 RepID=A0A6M3KU40_9ZZZZ
MTSPEIYIITLDNNLVKARLTRWGNDNGKLNFDFAEVEGNLRDGVQGFRDIAREWHRWTDMIPKGNS